MSAAKLGQQWIASSIPSQYVKGQKTTMTSTWHLNLNLNLNTRKMPWIPAPGPFPSSSGNIKNSTHTHTHTHSREISEFYPFVRDFKLRYYFLSAGYKHDTIQCIHINSAGHAPDVSVSLNKWHLRSWQCQDRCQPNGRQSCLPWPSKGCLQYIYKPLKVSYPARTSTNTFQDI